MAEIRLTFYEALKCCGICGQTNAAVGDRFNLSIDTEKFPDAFTPIIGTVTAVNGPITGDPPNTVVGYTLQVDDADLPEGVTELDNCDLTDVECRSEADDNASRLDLLEMDFGSTLAYAATLAWNERTLGKSVTLTLTGDAELASISNPTVGTYSMLVIQDGVGGHDLDISLAGIDKVVVLDTAASGRTVIKFHYDGTSYHLIEDLHEDRLENQEGGIALLSVISHTVPVAASSTLYEIEPDQYQIPSSGKFFTFDATDKRIEALLSSTQVMLVHVTLAATLPAGMDGKDLEFQLTIGGGTFYHTITPAAGSRTFSMTGFSLISNAADIRMHVANHTDTTDVSISAASLAAVGSLVDAAVGASVSVV